MILSPGWTMSKYFSNAVQDHGSRSWFVETCLSIIFEHKLIARIDLDWEYLSPPGQNFGNEGNTVGSNDAENFMELLKLLRSRLDQSGLGYVEITVCTSADPKKIAALPMEMHKYLATINIMTYDFATSAWGPTKASHQTNLYSTSYAQLSVDLAVKTFLDRGVPANKLVIGVATYSRGFANTDGLKHPSFGTTSDKSFEDGVVDYKSLPISPEYWDDEAKASFSYDPTKRELLSYDTVRSVREKAKYVLDNGLAGIIGTFVWIEFLIL